MDQSILWKLCWFIAQQVKAEQAYTKAQWRVSYYRKLKAKLDKSKKTSEKWNDHIDLVKKIESERLTALRKQKALLDAKKRLQKNIATIKSLNNPIQFQKIAGKTIGIYYFNGSWQPLNLSQILEMSDQYEANLVLNKILTKGKH